MKKLNKVAMLFATAALASAAGAQTVDNWRNAGSELVWKNAGNELCWRDASWTPATAAKGCDGAIVAAAPAPARAPAPAPAPVARPDPAPAPAPVAAPAPAPAAAAAKVTYAADAFFDFDRAVLKNEGKAKLDDLVSKVAGVNLEVVIAVGHTDAVGGDSYNQRLSVRRADVVAAALSDRGIAVSLIDKPGKGETALAKATNDGVREPLNRRSEVSIIVQ